MLSKDISILLVEDDEVDVMNVQRAFKKNDIDNKLYVCNNGLEGLEFLRKKADEGHEAIPQIILLDINMPKMGGLEFLTELRKDDRLKALSVFIMTTSNHDNDKVKAMNLNVAGYIIKPLSFEKFVSAVSILNDYWNLCEYKR